MTRPTNRKARILAAFVIDGGLISGLAGGPLSLAGLGHRTTRRASHLVFNDGTDLWEVLSADGSAVLHSDPDYDAALEWERDHFNGLLAQGVVQHSCGLV